MEVRTAYCEEDFEYDQLERLAKKGIHEANLRLMRQSATASLTALEGSLSSAAAEANAASEGGEQEQQGKEPEATQL